MTSNFGTVVFTYIIFSLLRSLPSQEANRSVSQDGAAGKQTVSFPNIQHLFLLTCKIPYHGALNSILYITGLDLMFPNANPTAPKLPFNPFPPHTPPFPLLSPPFSFTLFFCKTGF